MASEVDICNLALGALGDSATVASLSPPSGSAQSAHCSRFYPIARDALLEMHTWGFATTRQALALKLVNPAASWTYCYAAPNNVLNYIAVLDPNATDDYSVGVPMADVGGGGLVAGLGIYTPQPFAVETSADGSDIVLTNMQNAVLRYSQSITDTTQFSPLFTMALSHLLASMLAGPVLKGDAGAKEAKNQLQLFDTILSRAKGSDANDSRTRPAPGAPWMVNR